MNTIYLDPTTWDLTLDASRNIALAGKPYALAQDAASAIRTFLGECWYDTALGVPYWTDILGQFPPLELAKAELVAAAMAVPGVVEAKCFISSAANRRLTGQVQITDVAGNLSSAGF
jgi:hypothetical protein